MKGRRRSSFLSRRTSSAAAQDAETVQIICHPDAYVHALQLKLGLEGTLKQKSALTSPSCFEEMVDGLKHVVSCKYLLLVQSKGVLSHPWPLISTYLASRNHVPIICVKVEGGGYDFAGAQDHLTHLMERLDAECVRQVSRVLSSRLTKTQSSLSRLQSRLSELIPSLISVVYNPDGTSNELAGDRSGHPRQV